MTETAPGHASKCFDLLRNSYSYVIARQTHEIGPLEVDTAR